ncbi:MAG: GtrA family protein [Ndongobacter sp.]|nr:GtrA family protein [Ndongobacter sp.]
MKNILNKYRELITYLIFGVLTTLVNYVVYFVATRILRIDYLPANGLAWIISVLFAYWTNRKWVFQSTARGFRAIAPEAGRFIGGRVSSLILDMGIMYIGITLMGLGAYDFWVKTVSQVVVIVANYVISKYFVFQK